MSSNTHKRELEYNISELSNNVLLKYPLPDDVENLLTRANELTAFYINALKVGKKVKTFNTSNPNNMINTAHVSQVISLIIQKLLLIHDKFNMNRNTIVNRKEKINKFIQSRMIQTLLNQYRPQTRPSIGSPVRRVRSPSVARPSSSQVVSPTDVIINHESPNAQLGCFGEMCAKVKRWGRSIKSRFSRNSVHPDVGGKRKLHRRTRRTRRGRHSRLH